MFTSDTALRAAENDGRLYHGCSLSSEVPLFAVELQDVSEAPVVPVWLLGIDTAHYRTSVTRRIDATMAPFSNRMRWLWASNAAQQLDKHCQPDLVFENHQF